MEEERESPQGGREVLEDESSQEAGPGWSGVGWGQKQNWAAGTSIDGPAGGCGSYLPREIFGGILWLHNVCVQPALLGGAEKALSSMSGLRWRKITRANLHYSDIT